MRCLVVYSPEYELGNELCHVSDNKMFVLVEHVISSLGKLLVKKWR